jgi:hypothetical protein
MGRPIHLNGHVDSFVCIKAPLGDCGEIFRTSCHGADIYTVRSSSSFCDGKFKVTPRRGRIKTKILD